MSSRSLGNAGEDPGPGDWRRRRGGRGRSGSGNHPLARPSDDEGTDGKPVVSTRTLSRFLEPSLDLIGSFGAPIVLAGIVGLIAGGLVVAFVGSMRTYGYIDMGIGGGLILVVSLISLSSVIAAFFSRTGRYGINAAIMIIAFTGIVVVINFVSFEKNSRSDVTATNQFSLHSTTKQLLKELDEPVRATAFYLEDGIADPDQLLRRTKVEDSFLEFEAIRSSKFRFRFVDPTLDPEIVRGFFGSLPTPFINETIVVEGLDSGINHIIRPLDAGYSRLEQDLFTGILVVSGKERKTIYFLDGHGEREIESTAFGQIPKPEGFDSIRIGLQADNYDVSILRWNQFDQTVSVPDKPTDGCEPSEPDCEPGAALLVVAGPTMDLPLAHAQALDLFLQGKKLDQAGNVVNRREAGRLIFLAEPDTPKSSLDFLASWGILVRPGYIRDESRSIPSLPRTLQLELLSPLDPRLQEVAQTLDPATLDTLLGIIAPRGESLGLTRMPGAAPILISNDPNRFSAPLAITSRDSYFIDDLRRTEPVKDAGEESDPVGPFSAVWYIQAVGPVRAPALTDEVLDNQVARIVVFGGFGTSSPTDI